MQYTPSSTQTAWSIHQACLPACLPRDLSYEGDDDDDYYYYIIICYKRLQILWSDNLAEFDWIPQLQNLIRFLECRI